MRIPAIKACHFALFAALAGTSAHAVHLSSNGTGQVLIFPYYTARNGFSTLVSVDNTHNNTKILKVRFREGLNGREVFNFNLFLSPNDTWTGAVVETAAGARLVTNDNSCVTPADLFIETRKDILGRALNEFYNYDYTGMTLLGAEDAKSLSTLDRTREGYFEVVEMGVITPNLSPAASLIVGFVKQSAAGMPVNCAAMDAYDGGFGGNTNSIRFPDIGATLLAPPTGGLRGRASLIGAATGANYSFTPTALDGWSSRVAYGVAGGGGGAELSRAFPTTSTVLTPAGPVIANWTNGENAVSAVLMREAMTNEFVLDSGTRSQTDWIVAFPTKRFYVDGSSFDSPTAPFSSAFASNGTGSCDVFQRLVVDRETANRMVPPPPQGVPPPDPPPPQICWTVNGAAFGTPLLASRTPSTYADLLSGIGQSLTTLPGNATTPLLRGVRQGPNGKLTLRFTDNQKRLTPASAVLISPSGARTTVPGVHYGLPVIGLMLHNYQNANVASKYGGVIEHSYSVRIE